MIRRELLASLLGWGLRAHRRHAKGAGGGGLRFGH